VLNAFPGQQSGHFPAQSTMSATDKDFHMTIITSTQMIVNSHVLLDFPGFLNIIATVIDHFSKKTGNTNRFKHYLALIQKTNIRRY
jgi:hypothetical protein